jgi:hypothetical protein
MRESMLPNRPKYEQARADVIQPRLFDPRVMTIWLMAH